MVAPVPFELGLSAPSSATSDAGDVFNDAAFDVSFGDKIAGKGASSGLGFENLAQQVAVGLIIALSARFVWEWINK